MNMELIHGLLVHYANFVASLPLPPWQVWIAALIVVFGILMLRRKPQEFVYVSRGSGSRKLLRHTRRQANGMIQRLRYQLRYMQAHYNRLQRNKLHQKAAHGQTLLYTERRIDDLVTALKERSQELAAHEKRAK